MCRREPRHPPRPTNENRAFRRGCNNPGGAAQPCRALKRGFVLLMTYTRPLRRMRRQSLCRDFSALRERTIFIVPSLGPFGHVAGSAIGRASCGERVCHAVWVQVVAGTLKK